GEIPGPGSPTKSTLMPYCFSNGSVSTSCMSVPSGPNTATVPSFLAASTACCHSGGPLIAAGADAAGLAGLGEAAGAAVPPQAASSSDASRLQGASDRLKHILLFGDRL